MLTKKDSTIAKNDTEEQSSSLPNSSSFMMLFSRRKRSSSHPLSRTSALEGDVGDDLIKPETATSPRGFIPGLDFNQKEYDEKDAGAPIPSAELTSPRLFTPRNKPLSRAASTEAGITIAECQCEENRPAVASL
ncbi:hypothetical protein [Legionella shakespearei]|uniref:Uncharacterized protein n=1 Tax=Legionella shakespearei DSM 23087 TaxID=1122169 RepID=A0A0W0YJZ6_9GAMM|nr:hypothetical protein [Legionella shakespearei]KTD57216.1 hypothetical protein Lsha_2598 [Legionella shakespearei DSM 23087]